jgi:hypothetical protein
MKNKAKELDVDFIGGQNNPLTKEEEKAINDFIRADKEKHRLKALKKKQWQNKSNSLDERHEPLTWLAKMGEELPQFGKYCSY